MNTIKNEKIIALSLVSIVYIQRSSWKVQLLCLVCANSTNQIRMKLCPATRPILQHIIISKPSLKIPSRYCKLLQAIAGRDSNENKRKYVHRAGIVLHTWRFHCIVSRIHYTKVPYVSRKKTIVDRLSSPPSPGIFSARFRNIDQFPVRFSAFHDASFVSTLISVSPPRLHRTVTGTRRNYVKGVAFVKSSHATLSLFTRLIALRGSGRSRSKFWPWERAKACRK